MPVRVDQKARDILLGLVAAELVTEADLPLLDAQGDHDAAERVRRRGDLLRQLTTDLDRPADGPDAAYELTVPPAELAALMLRLRDSSAAWLADIVVELFQDDVVQVAREVQTCQAVLRQLGADAAPSQPSMDQ